jgi:hypothetical protein
VVAANQEQAPKLKLPAPTFEEIARSDKSDAEYFRGFPTGTQSNVSHPGAMPNPQLPPEQIDKIIAYIRSLRRD